MKAYGEIELTDSSPAQSFTEPLSVADAKKFLRVEVSDEDDLIGGFISAARETAEILQGRDLIAKQYDLHLDLLLGYDSIAGAAYPSRFNSIYNLGIGYEIELRPPLQSVDLFQYTDNTGLVTTLTENTDYVVDKNRSLVTPPYGKLWPFFTPAPTSSVLIRHTSGFSATHPFWKNAGARVLVGMKLLVTAWYENRIPYGNTRGQIDELPYAVTTLLSFGARPRVH